MNSGRGHPVAKRMIRPSGQYMVHKRRGNPNWGKPQALLPPVQTEFETVVVRLGLTTDNYFGSNQLRAWCERNSHRCYVPEWLLKEWGILPDVGWF